MKLSQTTKISKKITRQEKLQLAQSLKEYRQKRNLSQVGLARLIGASAFSISRWEQAKHYPPRTTMKLMKIIGI